MKENLSQETRMAAETNASRVQNLVKTILKIGFAAGIIAWMIHNGALDFTVFRLISSPALIIFCAACIFVQIFINNYRWLRLMEALGLRSTVGETMQLSLIGMFFNYVMPGGVGGDGVKGYYLVQDHPGKKAPAIVSVFMDRMTGFFVMIATAFFALFLNWEKVEAVPQLRSISVGLTLLFLCFIAFFAVSLSRRIGRSRAVEFVFARLPGGAKIRIIYEALHQYRSAKGTLVIAGLISLVNQGLAVAIVYVVGQAMGVHEIPLSMYFFLVPIGTVIQALPLSPAGIGVGQAAFYFLFNLYLGKQSQLGPTAVTLMQLLSFLWGLFGAFFYLRRKKPSINQEA
jgi:uncharacterized protein (TIRG00374 family)